MGSVYMGVGQGELLSRIRFSKEHFKTREEVLAYLKGAEYQVPDDKVTEQGEEWVATVIEGEAWSTRETEVTEGIVVVAIQPKSISGCGPMYLHSEDADKFAEFSTAKWDFDAKAWSVDDLMKSVPKAIATMAKKKAKDSKDGEVAKSDLKLPIREKGGKVSVAALRAVKAVLGGARGGVNLPADVKSDVEAEVDKLWAAWEKQKDKDDMSESLGEFESFAECKMHVFRVGTYRGKEWTESDLDKVVENFDAGTVGCANPLVLGHSEEQEILAESGLPAVGLTTKVWREGKDLWAKVKGIPAAVAKLLEGGVAYPSRSAEIYRDFVDDEGVHHGPALRRIALLGDEIPKVKNLGDVVALAYAEEVKLGPAGDAVWVSLSENPEEEAMSQKLEQNAGTATIPAPAAQGTPAATPPAAAEKHSEAATGNAAATGTVVITAGSPDKFAEFEGKLNGLTSALADKDKVIEDLRKQSAQATDRFAELDRRAARTEAESWVRQQVAMGRILPYESRRGMVELYMELSKDARVVKFSEPIAKNGDGSIKVEERQKSLLEMFKEFVAGLGERVPTPTQDGRDVLAGDGAANARSPKEAADLLAKFSEEYRRENPKASVTEARKAVTKAHPELDALRRSRGR